MPTFAELMEILRNPGETGIPADFAEQLEAAHTEDISIRDAAVSDREKKIQDALDAQAKRDEQIRELKARNYDLLVSAPKPGNGEQENENQDDDEPRGIASLFVKETR